MINLSCLPRVPTTEALRLAAFAAPDSVDISISDATRSVALDPAQNISPSYSSLFRCARPRGRPKKTWKEVVREDCQARKLNKEDAMDRCKWRKMIKEAQ